MSNLTTTNVDLGNVILSDAEFRDELIMFDGAGSLAEGTILGRLTAGGNLAPFDPAGTDGEEVPVAVITYDVEATGAGNVAARVMIAGKVRQERLIIDEDGDDSNIDNVILDQLRNVGITPVSVRELNILDNQ